MQSEERFFIKSEQVRWSEDTFHKTYDRFYQALVMYAMNYISDQAMAEDIVQDIFSQIWENKTEFASIPSLRVYLYNAVRNHVFDWQRKKKVASKYLKLNPPVNEIDVENSFVKEEISMFLKNKTMSSLGKQREDTETACYRDASQDAYTHAVALAAPINLMEL